jgi:NAD(P)-dependent dehydrogenase (short-subunit alcohol dehydrogenase family)
LKSIQKKTGDLLYDVLVKGAILNTQAGVEIMRKQAMGGDIINIVSKNALVSGPNNAAYGSASLPNCILAV